MPVITRKGDDGVVTAWFVKEGSLVEADQLIAEVQAEKIADEVDAPANGVVRDLVEINAPVAQGEGALCRIEAVADQGAESFVPQAQTSDTTGASAGDTAHGAIELTGLRAVIARNMRASHTDTAAVTLTTTVDVTDTLHEHITAWIVSTVATALRDHPDMNGQRDGDQFMPGRGIHIGVAIQTAAGLVAPVVRDADARSIDEIAADIADLAARASNKSLEAGDLEGGTFTVTNLGPFGVETFTPIINPPQVAILGVGAVRTVPGFSHDRKVIPRDHLALSLTFDHAYIDGGPAAAFLAQVRRTLE